MFLKFFVHRQILVILFVLLLVFREFNQISSIYFTNCFYAKDNCPNEDVTFWFYTRNTQHYPVQINELNIHPELFIPRKPLKIIIHGYTGHKDFSPNTYLRPMFFDNLDIFIISVDYGPIVREPCYYQAASNYLVAAKCTANLIDILVMNNYFSMSDIHVIGFSLGAHVAGAIASFLKSGKLSRITGLDPAKPLFEITSDSKKLDSSDADFVDVIHTDIFLRGMAFALGHVDFYPNGGTNQPGCFNLNIDKSGSCNHDRAPIFYAESIVNESLGFWGYECSAVFQYKIGICKYLPTRHQELMGYYVNLSARGMYFLETNEKSPYARGKYPHNQSNTKLSRMMSYLKVPVPKFSRISRYRNSRSRNSRFRRLFG